MRLASAVAGAIVIVIAISLAARDQRRSAAPDQSRASIPVTSGESRRTSGQARRKERANPQGFYRVLCSEDTVMRGSRFSGGGTVRNIGNRDILIRILYEWDQLHKPPVVAQRHHKLRRDQARAVHVSVPATPAQLTANEQANRACTVRISIVRVFPE